METHRKVPDWWTVRESRGWETRRKVAGWLNAGVGLLMLAGIGFVLAGRSNASVPVITLITAIGFPVLQLVGGIGFVFGHRWSRVLLWPVSVIDLLGFPVVTALGVYNLWVLYHTRGQTTTAAEQSGGAAA